MNILPIPAALVDVPVAGRPVSKETVASLTESIKEIGLINPITVIRAKIFRSGGECDGFRLVCGRHRFTAICSLGWDDVQASVIDSGESLRAELIEIDENLSRAELSPAQRAASIARRKEIWEVMHPGELSDKLSDKGPGRPVSFSTDTEDKTGEQQRDTRRHLARADALGPDLHAVVGTSLDKGVELDALAKLPPSERKDLIEQAQAGKPVSARKREEKNGTAAFFPAWCLDKLGEIADRFESDANCGVDEAVDKLVKLVDWNDRAYVARLREVAKFYAAIASVADVAEAKAAA